MLQIYWLYDIDFPETDENGVIIKKTTQSKNAEEKETQEMIVSSTKNIKDLALFTSTYLVSKCRTIDIQNNWMYKNLHNGYF